MSNTNISEDIKDITIKLEEILRKVNMVDNENKNDEKYDIEQIIRNAKQYQITEHPLSKSDEHIKKLYITVLSSVMQYDGKPIEDRLIFLSRIMQGCNIDVNLMDVIQYGINIDNQLYDEFIIQISKEDLQYNFIVDALIISSCDSKIEGKSIEYIAEIASVLNISNENMKILCDISNIILMQSQEIFDRNFDFIKSKLHYFICYTKEFVKGMLSDNTELFSFRGDSNSEFLDICMEDKIKVEIINAKINLNSQTFIFRNCQEIYLDKCSFVLETKFEDPTRSWTAIQQNEFFLIENCLSIMVKNVNFNMIGQCIAPLYNICRFSNCKSVDVEKIKFDRITMNSSQIVSSYMYFENIEKLKISEIFAQMCSLNSGNSYDLCGGIVLVTETKNSVLKNSEFIEVNLQTYKNDVYTINGSNTGLIYGIDKVENCESIKSANLTIADKEKKYDFYRLY